MGCSRARPAAAAFALALAASTSTFAFYLVGSGRSYDYDSSETVGSFIATPSLLDPFRRQLVYNNHPLFSFLDHLVYSAGWQSPVGLRVLPILFGALVVGIVVAWCARRWGFAAAAAAGFMLGANSSFAELSRSVRGYSLLCLAALVATLLLERLLWQPRRLFGAAYVVVLAAGIATHLYMLLVVAGHLGLVLARGGRLRVWLTRWLVAVALGALAYIQIGAAMFRSASHASHLFRPRFPLALFTTLLGASGSSAARALLGVLVIVGAAAAWSRALAISVGSLAAALLPIWVWVAPYDLYPRFLIWLAPLLALAVAAAVHRFPLALPLVAAAAVLTIRAEAAHWTQDPLPDRQAALLVRAIRNQGGIPCVLPFISGSLLAYTRAPAEVTRAAQLRKCQLVLSLRVDPRSLRVAAHNSFQHRWQLEAWTPMIVYSRFPRSELISPTGHSRGAIRARVGWQ